MYRFYINNVDNDYHYSELVRVFLPDELFELIPVHFDNPDRIVLGENSFLLNKSASSERDVIKRELYTFLCELCSTESEWGTLTGVRPLKLMFNLLENNNLDEINHQLKDKYMLSDAKLALLNEILDYQLNNLSGNPSDKVGVYIGIPFCPTRCAYCSFASNVAGEDKIQKYFDNLLKEIEYMGSLIRQHDTKIESLYIGGGTPTTLNAKQLDELITACKDHLGIDPRTLEFTIEAGRPDTFTDDKLAVMKDHGISRISINPQTLKDETLKLIGRDHTAQDIYKAYELAKKYEFEIINADLIAGLPEESFDDFKNTLNEIIRLGANNITVHTLSIKRGSRLRESDPEYYRRNAKLVAQMLEYSHELLISEGFYPYYIYRQKHQIGAFENVGYCKPGLHSIYNIRIMEEKQTIIALGAGGIGKVYFPDEDRLERIANVSNYEVYNERFDEILARKNNYYGGYDGN